MGKEFNAVEINVENLTVEANEVAVELNDLALSLIGGGSVIVAF